MAVLHLFRGIPGSSKSTSAERMFPGVVRFENDQFCMRDGSYRWDRGRVKESVAWCMDMARTALAAGMDCCVCNTFAKRRYVQAYKKIAEEAGAGFDVYRCVGRFKNVHGLSDEMVRKFEDAMEDWPGEAVVDPAAEGRP